MDNLEEVSIKLLSPVKKAFRTLSGIDHAQEDLEDVRGSIHVPIHIRASTAIGPTMEHTMNLVM